MRYTIAALLFLLTIISHSKNLVVGAEKFDSYKELIKNKRVAVVVNQSSKVKTKHLVDFLLENSIDIKKIFAPEHGFRGNYSAGAKVLNSKDKKTGLPILSLYGKNKKPNPQMLKDIDIIIYDIQDVGVRFYTYISTLHYVMEACAENNINILVLDRPNPNGFYIDGPVLKPNYKSFVGMHQVPIVYGMTVGEYAKMINGEKWLKNQIVSNLTVISCDNYDHNFKYKLPIKPSPNLPNPKSVYLYPSLCFFEGTYISAGRGTKYPFQLYGAPDLKNYKYSFTPKPIKGAAMNPKFKFELCFGEKIDFDEKAFYANPKIDLQYLIRAYKNSPKKGNEFFNSFIYKLSGTDEMISQIKLGWSSTKIRNTWKKDIDKFKKIRAKYLLYKDFD